MTLEETVKAQLGSLVFEILILRAENQTLKEENDKLKAKNATE